MQSIMVPTFGVAAPCKDATEENLNVTEEDLNSYRYFVDGILTKVHKLEEQVNEVEQFYQSTDVQLNDSKDKGREKHHIGSKKPLHRVSSREATGSEEMQELMRHFSKILHEITQHKWAWPFMHPVDVEGLGLYDYYEIIEKPMDFTTIKSKMEARDGSGYKNVREIYADVRLIFKNAMKYNNEKNDIHVMAKALLDKFEKKWLHLLPKVAKAESGLLKEEAHEQLDMQLAQEATYANMARELNVALSKVDMDLKNLKAMVIAKCRKLSAQEKVTLGTTLTKLSPENLVKALKIVSENNPTFQFNAEVVNLDIDAQSDYTLWRLNVFAKNALEVQGRTAEGPTVNHNDNIEDWRNNAQRKRVL